MASIVRDNTIINFDRIVFYGCSITAGSEIGNELFLNNDYKRKFDISDIDKIKKQHTRKLFIEKYINSDVSFEEIENYSKTKSWANKLAQLFNVDCDNRSVPAGNNQLSVHNIELDLSLSLIKDTDLVIVGISPYERWMWIDKNGNTHKTIFDWKHDWPSTKFYNEFLLYISNVNQYFFNTFLSLKHLNFLSKQLNNRILLQFMHRPWVVDPLLENKYKNLSNEVFKLSSIIDCNYSFSQIVKNWDDDVHGYSHPKEHHHSIMANYLYNKLCHR